LGLFSGIIGRGPIKIFFIGSFLNSSLENGSSSIFSTFLESLFYKPPVESGIIIFRGALLLRVGVFNRTEGFMSLIGINIGVLLYQRNEERGITIS